MQFLRFCSERYFNAHIIRLVVMMLGVRWGAVALAVMETICNLLLIIAYLTCLHKFPKRTLNILSLMVCDVVTSALTVVVHTANRSKVTRIPCQISVIFYTNSYLTALSKASCHSKFYHRIALTLRARQQPSATSSSSLRTCRVCTGSPNGYSKFSVFWYVMW